MQNLKAAAAAAERALQRSGGGGSGDCLRHNFSLVAGTVALQDGHLLSADEHGFLTTFQVSSHLPSPSGALIADH